MCDFKFDFSSNIDEDGTDDNDAVTVNSVKKESTEDRKQDSLPKCPVLRPAKEILLTDELLNKQLDCDALQLAYGDVSLSYVDPEELEMSIQRAASEATKDIEQAILSNSDLVPCVYEGGLKVWECSLDLVQYMVDQDLTLEGRLVLELGCGAGLPGLYAFKKGAEVHFQDYNEEALRLMTLPNARLNSSDHTPLERCRFFAGDWSLVQQLIGEEKIRYDVVLTSETIYSIASQPRFYNIIRQLLKPTGTVYLAAKTHYFGVGGGTRQFEEFVREQGEFQIAPCKVFSQGLKREILEMKFLQEKDP